VYILLKRKAGGEIMKSLFWGVLRSPVLRVAALSGCLVCTCSPAIALPILDVDTRNGFTGTNADDTIVGVGLLDILAEAEALGIDFSIIGDGMFDNTVTAIAQASGIDALAGEDIVEVAEPVTATATATATGAAADVSLTGDASADISVRAVTESTGIDGGDDGDSITNASPVATHSSAQTTAVSATLALTGVVANTGGAGDALAEAGTTSEAAAAAISGGAGSDQIDNSREISATAVADATSVSASFDITVSEGSDVAAGAALSDGSSVAAANISGIAAGADADRISNSGVVDLTATANAVGVAFSLDAAGSINGDVTSAGALSDTRTQATTTAVGIDAGSGTDELTNTALVAIATESIAIAVSGNYSVTVSQQGEVVTGGSVSDASTLAVSKVTGLDGGDGDDTITNIIATQPGIDLFAHSAATGVAATFNVAGSVTGAATAGNALSGARTDADARVTGIAGGGGIDAIISAARIDATAESTATAVSAGYSASIGKEGDVSSGAAVSDASSLASAQATGIDGGDDNDNIGGDTGISGSITLLADSVATGVAASFSVAGSVEGNAASGDALSAARTDADAEVYGIRAGTGSDVVTSAAAINASANATATAVSAGFSVEITKEGDTAGDVSGAAVSDASSLASTRATGIDGGDGDDTITSIAKGDDIIDLFAGSTATGVAASFTIAGSAEGGAQSGDALSAARTDADARATCITGGSGIDTILSATHINAIAESTATAVSAGFSVTVSKEGDVTAGAAVSDASSLASTRATGIDGGADDDAIGGEEGITGGIVLRADSTATGVAASFSVAGSVAGDPAAGDALSKARTDADATATAITGGSGSDVILSATAIDADATATATAVSAGFSVEITKGGDAEGEVSGAAALSDASSLATSRSTGIEGGEGDNTITSIASGDDIIDLSAGSTATGVAASITVSGQLQGDVASGGALSEASTTAEAVASAIESGSGDDTINNATDVIATTEATATGVSVGVFVGITGDGDITNTDAEAAGSALSDASSVANATATGISSGDGTDDVHNSGELGLFANAHATGVAVSLGVAGSASGDVEGGAVSDASVVAETLVTGIDGGDGSDSIFNEGTIRLMDEEVGTADAEADAIATAVAVSLTVSGSLEGDVSGAALSDASATAIAFATGLAGGAGIDSIDNRGYIVADVGAETTAVAVSVEASITADGNASGAALSDSSATALAAASGIDGGDHGDDIDNLADIDITTDAESDSVSVSVELAGSMGGVASGEAMANASADSIASSVGINGGSGDDDINTVDESFEVNELSINTHSRSDAAATAVSVTLAGAVGAANGAAVADASATAESFSTGIGGGTGEDVINNASAIEATAEADATASSTTVTVTISAGAADSVGTGDSGATARATTAGIDGDEEGDTITNSATLYAGALGNTPMAQATAGSTTVSVGVTVGAAESEAAANAAALAEARAAGISGGSGGDEIINTGAIRVGVAMEPDEFSTLALARAGSQTVDIGISLGESFRDASSDASATALSDMTGIAGGAGTDLINHTGTIDTFSSATAESDSKTTQVSLALGKSAGGATADAASLSTALGTGIDGGLDADHITTNGDVTVEARSVADTKGTSMNLELASIGDSNQSAEANSSSTAEAIARGVYGGSGNDTITAAGVFTITADSDVISNSRSSTLGVLSAGASMKQAQSRAETTASSLAVGIDGDAGDDIITSTATLDLNTFANALTTAISSTNSGLNIAGASSVESIASAATTVTAAAIGIRGGAAELNDGETDVDMITSDGSMSVSSSVSATTQSTSNADSLAVFGSAEGKAVSDASAQVVAAATGIDAGADDDVISSNNLMVSSTSESSVNATSNVDADVVFGNASSQGASDASANVAAEALAIDGGSGADIITSQKLVTVEATSTGSVTSISNVDADVTFGSAASKGASDASANVAARAQAINGGSGADTITTYDTLMVTATSTGSVTAASNVNADVTFGSASSGAASDASASRLAEALGITGGDGADTITNHASLLINALSDGSVSSKAHANADSTFGDASSSTVTAAAIDGTAVTVGITGGNEDDIINNLGAIDAVASAILHVTSSSVSIADSTFGDAFAAAASVSAAEGKAGATGIRGDDGNDVIENAGAVNSMASSTTTIDSVTVALADSTFGDANTVATSANFAAGEVTARGIMAGGGNDEIQNADLITVVADNSVNVKSLTVSGSGPASSDAETRALAYVVGADGGAGADLISNMDTILVKAAPRISSATRTFGSKGHVDGKASILLNAAANGISGGAGNDVINNTGDVLAFIGGPESDSTITLDAAAGTVTITDSAFIPATPEDALQLVGKWIRFPVEGSPDFVTRIVAFDTLTGTFTLRDPLPYDLSAGIDYTLYDYGDKQNDITSVNVTVGGNTFVDASTTASIQAQGITGGEGDDQLSNTGTVAVSASNRVEAVTVTVTRNIVADSRVESSVKAVGIAGNDQSDTSDRSVAGSSVFTDLSRKGTDPDAIIGQQIFIDSGASAGFTSYVSGFDADTGAFTLTDLLPSGGLARGDSYTLGGGSDFISNLGEIDVVAEALINATSWSLDFGTADVEAKGVAQSDAAGIRTGGFADFIQNDGEISTRSVASVSSTDRLTVIFGSADQELFFEASSKSAGVETGAGDDEFINAENGSINAESVSTASVDGVTAVLFAKITNSVDAITDSMALGVDLGEGQNVANTDGGLTSTSLATVIATAISEFELGETDADADAIANATARGIQAGDDEDQVFNSDSIVVNASADATSTAQGARVGNKDETSSVTEDGNEGDNFFFDASLIPEEGEPPVDILGEWIRFITGENEDFFARVDAFDPTTGELTLNKSLIGNLQAEVVDPDTGEIITPADLYTRSAARNGTSAATAAASAIGIHLGDGNAVIGNENILVVHAVAIADTTASSFGGTAVASAEASADARGIVTGNGDDTVGNLDTITVTAEVLTEAAGTGVTETQIATARGIETGAGVDTVLNEGEITVRAITEATGAAVEVIGIHTGEGNDIVMNAGTGSIAATTEVAGVLAPATAVSTGEGQDQLSLLGNSAITGHIDLGPDDDLLTLADAATLTGEVKGGTGTDTLRLEDRGTFALTAPVEVERLQVNQGVLEFTGDYLFPADSLMQVEIYNPGNSEPGHGQLVINGEAGLAGTATVTALPRIYTDGESLPLLSAESFAIEAGIPTGFPTVNLPPDSALVNFGYDYRFGVAGRDLFEVTTAVDPFKSVAHNSLQRAVAGYLQRIAPAASGDLAEVIGTIQLLPSGSDFDTAFSSLAPDTYDNYTQATFFGVYQYQEVLSRRMRARRAGSLSPQSAFVSDRSLLLAYTGESSDIRSMYAGEVTEVPAWWRDVWVTAFGQWGDQDGEDGYTGFDYDVKGITVGIDRAVNDRLFLGASAAYADTDVDQDKQRGNGEIEGWMASLYGSYSLDKAYVDGSLSYGSNDYDVKRKVRVGDIQRTARSDHDGDVFAASLESGYPLSKQDTLLEPFGRLQYIRLEEDAFTESGADSVNQHISSRDTDSLTSEIGLRVSRVYQKAAGWLTTDASVAWLHDFDIDDRTITTSYTGAPASSFSIPGQDVEKNGVTLGFGVGFESRKGVSTSLNYNGEFRDGFSAHGVVGRISYRF